MSAISRRLLLGAAAATLAAGRARADSPVLRIGVLTDLSGPYKDLLGPLGIDCGRQAVADFGVADKGFTVEILSADHQNKADIGAGIARQWFDRDGVDIIVEGGSSSVALAVSGVAHEKNKVYINSGASSSDLTGLKCNANTMHWVYDGYMLSRSTCTPIVRGGGRRWFFVAADYAFGHALVRDATGFITAAGGAVVNTVYYPFPGTADFSSLLLQAQASGADVLGFANSGADLINSIKQAHEFALPMRVAGMLMFITDVHSLGLELAQGLIYTDSFYWDYSDRTRAFSERVRAYAPQKRPSMINAGVYSSVLHYLKTAHGMGIAQARQDGAATVAAMKRLPTDDDAFGPGVIRADGRKLCPAFLWQVKSPAESRGPWDYCKLLATTPADQAFRPLAEGGCKLGQPT